MLCGSWFETTQERLLTMRETFRGEGVNSNPFAYARPQNRTSVNSSNLEAAMDDEKSITEKLTAAISKAADSVKSAVSHVVDSASNAAQHAMEANAEKISRIPPARADLEQVATTTNEQIYIPQANDAAAMPMPLVPMASAPKKKPRPSKPAAAKLKSKMPAVGKKQAVKKKAVTKKPATKSAKKAATKYAAKKTRKAAKKSSVRSSKKARRKPKK
jgi:hypothetical protein